jgi:hypothetical protein
VKYLSVFIVLLFFVTVSSASILDFQNDFTKATGLCFKPKISAKTTKLNLADTSTKITTELKFFDCGVISVRGGINFPAKKPTKGEQINSYAKLTLNVKKVVGETIYDKFPSIVDKLELAVGYGKEDKLSLEFCLEI